ncbi:hypothetical protein [Sphingomonas humi]
MSTKDRDYMLARAAQERAMAEQAPDEIIGEIHLQLAHEYEVRANVQDVASRAGNDALGLVSGGDRSS